MDRLEYPKYSRLGNKPDISDDLEQSQGRWRWVVGVFRGDDNYINSLLGPIAS